MVIHNQPAHDLPDEVWYEKITTDTGCESSQLKEKDNGPGYDETRDKEDTQQPVDIFMDAAKSRPDRHNRERVGLTVWIPKNNLIIQKRLADELSVDSGEAKAILNAQKDIKLNELTKANIISDA